MATETPKGLELLRALGHDVSDGDPDKPPEFSCKPIAWHEGTKRAWKFIVKWPGHEHVLEFPWMCYRPQWYQIPYHVRHYRIKAFSAANSTGKSWMGRAEIVWSGEGVHPWDEQNGLKGPFNLLVSVTEAKKFDEYMKSLLEGFMTKVDGELAWNFSRERLEYVHKQTGSHIFIKSDEQGIRSVLSYEASRFHKAWLDEAHAMSNNKAVMMRTTGLPREQAAKGGQLLLTLTGLDEKAQELNEEWLEPHRRDGKLPHLMDTLDATGREFITMYDNKELSEEDVRQAEETFTGRDKEIRVMGKMIALGSSPALPSRALYELRKEAKPGEQGRLVVDEKASGPPEVFSDSLAHSPNHWKFIPTEHGEAERWESPRRDARYVVVGDPGSGRGRAESVWSVWDIDRVVQVYEWASREANLVDYADEGIAIGWHYNKALVVVLYKQIGEGVAHILAHERHYPNLYRDPDNPRLIGWTESESRKKIMVARATVLLQSGKFGVRSPKAIDQCMALQWEDKGNTAAIQTRGRRLDRCVAALVAVLFCEEKPPNSPEVNPELVMPTLREQIFEHIQSLGRGDTGAFDLFDRTRRPKPKTPRKTAHKSPFYS